MLTAVALAATLAGPNVYGELQEVGGAYPYRLLIRADGPMPTAREVRVRLRSFKVNGRTTRARIVPSRPGALTMPKGGRALTVDFRFEPAPRDAWLEGQIDLSTPGSPPSPVGIYRYALPADGGAAELRRIQARYVGRDVWLYGGEANFPYRTDLGAYFVGLRPLRVTGVSRRPSPNRYGDVTARPLVMTFAPIANARVGVRDEQRRLDVYPAEPGTVREIFLTAPTGLILSESLSLTPPPATWRRDASRIETAMREFDVERFDRKRDVLWLLGPPDTARPWKSVFAQDQWVYSIAAPFSHVLKFRRGVVVSRDRSGELP
jgi:hypothetical protein